jgi:hypothetical protein
MKKQLKNKFRNFILDTPFLNPYGFNIDRMIRNLTAWSRLLPDVSIVGNNKSASNTIFYNLLEHPQIKGSSRRENRFFDANYWRGTNWYRSYFPTKSSKIKFEKNNSKMIILDSSPTAYLHPFAAQRIKKLLPNAKLIILFRNPADHAYSLYQHKVRMKVEKETFETCILQDQERFEETEKKWRNDEVREYSWKDLRLSYVSDGIYFNHIEKWFSLFPKENIHCIDVDELAKQPIVVLNKICTFLHLPTYTFENYTEKNVNKEDPRKKTSLPYRTSKKNIFWYKRYKPMNSATRKKLIEFYKPHNKKLESFLNMKFNWDV